MDFANANNELHKIKIVTFQQKIIQKVVKRELTSKILSLKPKNLVCRIFCSEFTNIKFDLDAANDSNELKQAEQK